MLLAGDIGGTKTELPIFSRKAPSHRPLTEATFVSADYPSLEEIVKEVVAKAKKPVPPRLLRA